MAGPCTRSCARISLDHLASLSRPRNGDEKFIGQQAVVLMSGNQVGPRTLGLRPRTLVIVGLAIFQWPRVQAIGNCALVYVLMFLLARGNASCFPQAQQIMFERNPQCIVFFLSGFFLGKDDDPSLKRPPVLFFTTGRPSPVLSRSPPPVSESWW